MIHKHVIEALKDDIRNYEFLYRAGKILHSINCVCFATNENNEHRNCNECVIKKYTGVDDCENTPKQRWWGPNEEEIKNHEMFLRYVLYMEISSLHKGKDTNKE